MSSYSASEHSEWSAPGARVPSLDTSRVLLQTMDELERVRQQLRQPFSAKANIEAALARLENGLKSHTQEVLQAQYARRADNALTAANQVQYLYVGATYKAKAVPLPPIVPSAAERVAMFKADPLHKPQTDAARAYLQDRFGVASGRPRPSPSSSGGSGPEPRSSPLRAALSKGLTPGAAPAVILPRAMRLDPYAAAPPAVADLELDKGLLHLVNRGMLHSTADLTPALCGEMGPVRMASAMVHPHEQQFARPPATSALEDSMLAAQHFRLDPLTPVAPPPAPAAQQAALRLVNLQPASGQLGLFPSSPSATRAASQQGGGGGGGPGAAADKEGGGGAEGEEARPYDALMDTFSLHEFLIRKGVTIDSTPEFESYRRTYQPLWGVIAPLLHQLELLCKQYAVPLAIVDGRSLADLANGCVDSKQPPQMQDLLVCIQNIQEVAGLLRQPGRRFMGESGPQDAAKQIQAAWRGHLARRKWSKAGVAAAAIQGAWRMHRLRAQLKDRLQSARVQRSQSFQALQQQLAAQWGVLQGQSHVVVHVPCLHRTQAMTPEQKAAQVAAEAGQLARLCDLAEPLVEVLLLLPSPLDPDVAAYWDKILEVGGVSQPASRYRIIYPENHNRLPVHMSTTAMLLTSPRALKRLRSAVSGRPGYIVPGCVSDEEVDLAVALGLPLLSAAPHIARTLTRKSAAKALFASAGALTAPGLAVLPRAQLPPPPVRLGPNQVPPLTPYTDFQITEEGDVLVTESAPPPPAPTRSLLEEEEARIMLLVAEAMVRWPWASQWLLKVDDEVGGAGHASFHTAAIKGAADVLERTREEEGEGSSGSDPTQPLSEWQQVARYRLNELLLRQLPRKLALAARDVYPSYRDYIHALGSRGGLVEVAPHCVVGSPQANLFISPCGSVALLSTHEKIFVAPFRAVGSSFPQTSVPHRALLECANAIGIACAAVGVMGHVTVDFVTSSWATDTHMSDPGGGGNGAGGGLRLWAVDLVLHPTASLMAYQLFDFLTVGRFDPVAGVYQVALQGGEGEGLEGEDAEEAAPLSARAPLPPPQAPQHSQHLSNSTEQAASGPPPSAPASSHRSLISGLTGLATGAALPSPMVSSASASSRPYTVGADPVGQGPGGSALRGLSLADHHTGPAPLMTPPAADPALMGERPQTSDLPSCLPSTRTSSIACSSRGGTAPPNSSYGRGQGVNTTMGEEGGRPTPWLEVGAEPQQGPGAAPAGLRPWLGRSSPGNNASPQSPSDYPQRKPGEQGVGAQAAPTAPSAGSRGDGGTQRCFFSLDAVSNPGISSLPCVKFFHACWQEGLHFDVDNRVGVIFNLSDKYTLGTIGVLTVGLAAQHMFGSMHEVLNFITAKERAAAQAAATAGPAARRGRGGDPASNHVQLRAFRDVQLLVKYMAEKSAVVAAAVTGRSNREVGGAASAPANDRAELCSAGSSITGSTFSMM
ncbi:hypothetical protein V8C86DRAFT_1820156 [Haematococcus lacustris]